VEQAVELNRAFDDFTRASKSLEQYYEMLSKKVDHLTNELEQKNAELEEMKRQDERNQRLISMGEMAAKIVHEIRSPLCSIELFSNMLSNDLKDTVHAEMAGGISTGIKSLNTILTNMLYFAKHQKPRFKELKPLDIIEECINVLAPLIDVRHIKVLLNVSDGKVAGDSELLKQVFMNIILNAIQAMPDGGSLRIESSVSGNYSVVSVIDEGKGILPENIEKIFDPFFSTKDKGSGLGLAISNKIMQSHEGSIKAFRNTGKGSTFSVYFLSGKMPEAQDRKKNSVSDAEALRNIYTENDSFQIPLVRSI
jgi:signal transduction histidine kinase